MQQIPAKWTSATHAIVVCGHAIYVGGPNLDPPTLAEQDQYWILQSFQRGEGHFFIEHIRAGVELAAVDPQSLLIFSGGQTRHSEVLSEAQSYCQLAISFNFWGHPTIQSRMTTEEFSRDSYDNLLFSIARFYECTSSFPQKVTLISWSFKRKRFHHHAQTINWPLQRMSFVGIGTPDDLQSALTSEAKTLSEFKNDQTGYGNNGSSLGTKKAARNPFLRQHGYRTSCPVLIPLLDWTEPTSFPKEVPWELP